MNFLSTAQIDLFANQGYVVLENLVSPDELISIQQEFDQLLKGDTFKKAQVTVRSILQSTVHAAVNLAAAPDQDVIRGDWTYWLDDKSPPAVGRIYSSLKNWQLPLNQNFYCGITHLEAHLAYYPAGPGYQKHFDQASGKQQRKISFILYLNPDWLPKDGGELVLYAPDSKNILEKIEPQEGRLMIFQSHIFPHEVLPCQSPRRSLTGWFRSDAL